MRPDDLAVTNWGARFLGRTMPCSVGRAGIGEKRREGDGITPAGRFAIKEIWHRPDRTHLTQARPIGLQDAWCDDPADARYNEPILTSRPGEEKLRRADGLYDLIGVLDYNMSPAVPGIGSAIFLHIWRKPRHPTAGCVAFSRPNLEWIIRHWKMTSEVVILG